MRKLLRVLRGTGVSDSNDISKYIPDYSQTMEYSMGLWDSLMQLDHNCPCGCDHDGYFAGVVQAPVPNNPFDQLHSYSKYGIDTDKPFGGYANGVHETPGHKCYPYHHTGLTGSTMGNGDVNVGTTTDSFVIPISHDPRSTLTKEYIARWLNKLVLHYTISALMIKKYHSDKPVREINMEKMFFDVLEMVTSYVATGGKEIVGISCVDAKFGDSPNMFYQNVILIHIDDVGLTPNFRELSVKLGDIAGVVVRYGTQTEIEQVLQHKDTIMNWSFGIFSDDTTVSMIFSGCRTTESNQYKVRVLATPNIGTNVPVNVEMLVDKGSSLSIVAAMDNRYMLGAIQVKNADVGSTTVPITAAMMTTINNMGIVIDLDAPNPYPHIQKRMIGVQLASVKCDTEIMLIESRVADDPAYFSINTDKYFVFFSGAENIGSGKTITPLSLELCFNDNVQVADIGGISVQAFPVDMYNIEDIPQFYRTPRTVEMIPVGFGNEPVWRVNTAIGSNMVNQMLAVMVRVCFEEGSLYVNTTSGQVRNPKMFMQFECISGQGLPATSCISVVNSVNGFAPPVPSTVSFAKLAKEQTPYFILQNNMDGTYNLSNITGKEVPAGLTNKSEYNLMDVMDGSGDGEKYYFAQIMIPLMSMYDNKDMVAGDFFRKIDVSVYSRICGRFYMVYDDAEFCGPFPPEKVDGQETFCVNYKGLQRPWVDGYIEIPVIFAADDVVKINIPSLTKCITINVSLHIVDQNPEEPEPELPEESDPFSPGINIISSSDIVFVDGTKNVDEIGYYTAYILDPTNDGYLESGTVISDPILSELKELVGTGSVSSKYRLRMDTTNVEDDGNYKLFVSVYGLPDDSWVLFTYAVDASMRVFAYTGIGSVILDALSNNLVEMEFDPRPEGLFVKQKPSDNTTEETPDTGDTGTTESDLTE